MIATVMFMMTAMLTMLPNSLWKAPQTAQQVAQWAVLSKVQWWAWCTAEVLPYGAVGEAFGVAAGAALEDADSTAGAAVDCQCCLCGIIYRRRCRRASEWPSSAA